jgi:hypothetical protein
LVKVQILAPQLLASAVASTLGIGRDELLSCPFGGMLRQEAADYNIGSLTACF